MDYEYRCCGCWILTLAGGPKKSAIVEEVKVRTRITLSGNILGPGQSRNLILLKSITNIEYLHILVS